MKGLGKVYPPDQVVFKDIWLSFLLRREDRRHRLERRRASRRCSRSWPGSITSYIGEATLSAGYTVGFLPQEPQLDPSEDRARQRRGRRRADSRAADALRRDQREVRRGAVARGDGQGARGAGAGAGRDRRRRRLGPRLEARARDGRAAAAAGRRRRHEAVGRRAPPRRAVPAAAAVARPAAARRADQPSRRRVGRLARAVPPGVPGHGRRDHARSLLPRQRRRTGFSSSIARSAYPVGRQLLGLARAEAAAAGARGEDGDRSASARWSASSSGSACRRARGRPRARRA